MWWCTRALQHKSGTSASLKLLMRRWEVGDPGNPEMESHWKVDLSVSRVGGAKGPKPSSTASLNCRH